MAFLACELLPDMSTPRITSPSNPRIKQARALGRRKERDAGGLCVVEGIFHVGEAVAAAEAGQACATRWPG